MTTRDDDLLDGLFHGIIAHLTGKRHVNVLTSSTKKPSSQSAVLSGLSASGRLVDAFAQVKNARRTARSIRWHPANQPEYPISPPQKDVGEAHSCI
jgi:hypothetical protein